MSMTIWHTASPWGDFLLSFQHYEFLSVEKILPSLETSKKHKTEEMK